MRSELKQRRAAETLNEADGLRHLQIQTLALESIGNAVLILDIDGTIQFSNHVCYEMYGYSAEELFGRLFKILSTLEVKPRSIQMPKDSANFRTHVSILQTLMPEGKKVRYREMD